MPRYAYAHSDTPLTGDLRRLLPWGRCLECGGQRYDNLTQHVAERHPEDDRRRRERDGPSSGQPWSGGPHAA